MKRLTAGVSHHKLPGDISTHKNACGLRQRRQRSSIIPHSVRAALVTEGDVDSNYEDIGAVEQWLTELGMREYISAFRANGITGTTLLSLSSSELRDALGVLKLKDRRVILDGIFYLRQKSAKSVKLALPEDGRILTHLSNERVFLSWIRLHVITHTVGMATFRLQTLNGKAPQQWVFSSALGMQLLALLILLYSAFRYHRMIQIVEQPDQHYSPTNVAFLLPATIACVGTISALYVIMTHSIEQVSLLALLTI